MRTIKETLIEIQTTSVEITVYEELESIVKSMTMPSTDTLRLNRINSRTVISEGYYYVHDDIIVEEDGELIIEPGVQLNFTKGKGIIALGKLFINGTPDNMVIVTGNDWSNISIIGKKSEGSTINFAIVYDGNGRNKILDSIDSYINSNERNIGGNIYTEYSDLNLLNTILLKGEANVGGGLYCYSGGLNAENIIVYKNKANSGSGGIHLANVKRIRSIYSHLVNSKIINNFGFLTGGLDIFSSRIVVNNCLVKFNKSSDGCGGICLNKLADFPFSTQSNIRILNTTIENNEGLNCGGINYQNSKPLGDDVLSNIVRNNTSSMDDNHNIQQW